MGQDWFTANAPKAAPAPAGDWFGQNSPQAPGVSQGQPDAGLNWIDQLIGTAQGFGRNVNPITAVQGMAGAVRDPIGTGQHMGQAQGRLAQEAQAAFEAGDYLTGTRKLLGYLTPILGPALDGAADKFAEGKWGEGTGESLGIGATTVGPAAVSRARAFRPQQQAIQPPAPRAPVDRAVAWGQQNRIPIDAATASQSGAVRALQRRSSDSLGGAAVAENFQNQQAHALARTGENLSSRVHPTAVPAEIAGQNVRTAVQGRHDAFTQAATQAYTELRALEQAAPSQTRAVHPGAPFQSMRLAVDIRPTKAALGPVYKEMLRESQLAPLQGSRARALVALDRLMQADDFAPLSIVDGALGDLKALQRATTNTPGSAPITQVVGALDDAVKQTAIQAGPNAIRALMKGRTNTVAKYKTLEVLDTISEEPVRAFRQATFANDAGIQHLRRLNQLAPQEMRQVGRAWLDDAMTTATQEGGFQHTQRLHTSWTKLGPETKKILFKDPALVKELDNFFLLAKKMAENPNPSGTARSMTIMNVGSMLPLYAVSKLMHSPAGVRLVTRGTAIQKSNTAALNAWRADAMALLERESTAVAQVEGETAP